MSKIDDLDKFRELLDGEYSWPAKYTFKFIVPSDEETKVTKLFGEAAQVTLKPSSGGKYTSVTAQDAMDNADEIIEIYQKASKIEGIISL